MARKLCEKGGDIYRYRYLLVVGCIYFWFQEELSQVSQRRCMFLKCYLLCISPPVLRAKSSFALFCQASMTYLGHSFKYPDIHASWLKPCLGDCFSARHDMTGKRNLTEQPGMIKFLMHALRRIVFVENIDTATSTDQNGTVIAEFSRLLDESNPGQTQARRYGTALLSVCCTALGAEIEYREAQHSTCAIPSKWVK